MKFTDSRFALFAIVLCVVCCASAQMPADFTNNKIVNFADLAVMGEYWLDSVPQFTSGDADGDGNVKIYLAGDALGPATYLVNARFDNGITADITSQTHVTFIFR